MTGRVPAPAAQRVFDRQRVWRLEPATVADAAALLASHLAAFRPDGVVGIARGGLPLAAALGAALGLEVLEVRARHNRSDALYVQATGQVQVTGPLTRRPEGAFGGRRLLVADDICGTGATLQAVVALVSGRLAAAAVRTVVLCRNAAAAPGPDVWLWDTRDWVVFPWDPPSAAAATQPLPTPTQVHLRKGAER